jgi:hypothetical protein
MQFEYVAYFSKIPIYKEIPFIPTKMKVAVIYTGALRTVEKTIEYLKRNVLLNDDVHVFACLENDTDKPTDEWEKWFHSQLGTNLKDIAFGKTRDDWTFRHLRERMLTYMNITENWKGYLRSSGSIIEHYQIWLTNQIMIDYEQKKNMKYDYVIRCRTDTIFGKSIDFKWLHYSVEEVENRLEKVKQIMFINNIPFKNDLILYYFMTTLIHDDILENIPKIQVNKFYNTTEKYPVTPDEIKEYIKNGRFILSLRENLLYIIKREYFSLIPSVGIMYGTLRFPGDEPIWFNSESQFKAICYNSQITQFDYSTEFESKSLYEFDKNLYFDNDYNLKVNNLLYCLVRK